MSENIANEIFLSGQRIDYSGLDLLQYSNPIALSKRGPLGCPMTQCVHFMPAFVLH